MIYSGQGIIEIRQGSAGLIAFRDSGYRFLDCVVFPHFLFSPSLTDIVQNSAP